MEPDLHPPEKSHYELLRFCRMNKWTHKSEYVNTCTKIQSSTATFESTFRYLYIIHYAKFKTS